MESDRKGKVLHIDSDRNLCPLCPQKLKVPVKYTVSKLIFSSINTIATRDIYSRPLQAESVRQTSVLG